MTDKLSIFTPEVEKDMQNKFMFRFSCMKCTAGWDFIRDYGNLNNILSDIRKHINQHIKEEQSQ
jgi:hypothetical protein